MYFACSKRRNIESCPDLFVKKKCIFHCFSKHICREGLICKFISVFPGWVVCARGHPKPATCIWPRSSWWTPTGPRSQPPPPKPTVLLMTSESTPSIHSSFIFHTKDMLRRRVDEHVVLIKVHHRCITWRCMLLVFVSAPPP